MADDCTANINTTGRLDSGLAAGNLEVIGDHDWFRVRLYAGHNYIIDQRGSPSGGGTLTDPFLAIRDSAGNLITSNDDGGFGFESQLAFHANVTGDYFVDAGAFNDGLTGTYALQLTDLGVGAVTDRFQAPPFGNAVPSIPVYGSSTAAGGWTTQDQYPRAAADVSGDGQ